jgi:1-acyl-sn-glycerol-3-phosphate acyltransferase
MRLLINAIQVLFIWIWTILCASSGFVLLPFLGQKRSIYVVSQWWSTFILGLSGVKLDIIGLENLPHEECVIFTANHESSFDIPVLFKALPVPLFFLAKAELKKIPVFGWFVQAVGMVFLERKDHKKAMEGLKKAGEEIRKGKNIMSFPEGTRTRDGQLKLFKRGSFVLALETGINIVPIAIIGTRQINPPGYRIQPGRVRVVFGKMVEVSNFDKKHPDILAKHVEDVVKELRIKYQFAI